MSNSVVLPPSVQKYFWGDDLKQLDWTQHQRYIVQTVLDKGDTTAVKWLFAQLPKQEIKSFLPELKLNKKSANFWSLYLS